MADKELLKQVLNDLINDKQESASVTLHSYLTTKTQKVSGLVREPEIAEIDNNNNEEEITVDDDDEVVET